MRLRTLFATLALVGSVFAMPVSAQNAGNASFVSGEVLVKFRPGVAASARADVHRENGGNVRTEITSTGLQRVAVAAGSESAVIARYRRNPNVLYAEPNYVRRLPEPLSNTTVTELLPGDHYFREQWALHNTGQLFYCFDWLPGQQLCLYIGTPDADIDAPAAWALSTGSNVVVAIIDSGIDYTHPEFAGRFIGGWDFLNNDPDPMDDLGHGTHVAGTIAAAINNPTGDPAAEEGVAGVAPDALILSYKVCGPDGHCNDFAIAQALDRAVADGAKIVNMSLGGTEYSQAMFDAVQRAWNAGLVIVAGSGNSGVTTQFYPAAFPNVVAVGAFDEDHRRASFSNYGNWVDISAPGNVIMSSYPMWTCPATTIPGDIGCYTWSSGTSMATPHVSGAAALVWARNGGLTNSQVVDTILNSADPVGVDAVRLDSWTAHGGLNVQNAVSYGLTNIPPAANAGPDQAVTDSNGDGMEQVTLDGSNSSDSDGSIVAYEWREGSTVLGVVASPSVWLNVGTHTLTLQVTDDAGTSGTDTVVVTVNAAPNFPPVADAGADQIVTDSDDTGSESVTLNGSASGDSDGSIVTYAWREGVNVVATGPTPTVSLSVGTHTLTLEVTDDDGASSTDTVLIAVNPAPNVPPVANAGVDQTVTDVDGSGAELVTLNGTGSSDSDGSIVTYAWHEGSNVVATGPTPSVPLSVGTHTLTLRVTDDDGSSSTDSVLIAVNPRTNVAPVANAGADQTVVDNDGTGAEVVTLNGTASSDSDGAIVSYVWREGTTVVGAGVSPNVSFTVGVHTLTLQVTDEDGASSTDSVVVQVNAAATVHVGDLDSSATGNKSGWLAAVTITVHDGDHQPVSGAQVNGFWNGGSAAGACTTGGAGTCVVTRQMRKRDASVPFTVSGITATGRVYRSTDNHDPDLNGQSSNGTSITVVRP